MHILIAEDNQDHLELIVDMLRSSFGRLCKIRHHTNLGDAIHYLERKRVDIFLCDLKLPDSSILQTVERIKILEDAPPIIVLTSLHDHELAQHLVKEGIQDFLPKDELTPSQLVRACHYAIERKKLTRSLLEKNEDYKAFCYSLTHDFKSSLWQISRFAQIFKLETQKRYPDDTDLPYQYLDKISSKIEGIQKLIEDLQDFLSIDSLMENYQPISLTLAARNAADMLGETVAKRNGSVEVEQLPEVNGNISQIQLLFSNLISNAIKYNDSKRPLVRIYTGDQSDDGVSIVVEDNGIGIPQDKVATIFTPFERLHRQDQYSGSGLGLSIAKRIMQSHGGKVQVDSTPGEGTRFILLFPRVQER
ncbi:MAG: ATP-binding protein [Cellvibrionaceae bacterium]|nr:ATP-binding protein [Cellvibrionaceae bacterium]